MENICGWVDPENQLYVDYHDNEWGVPLRNDRKLFEMLILEGAQAGLSWATILKKRKNYRNAFNNFDYNKIALYNNKKVRELLDDPGIVRNRLKINSAIQNAKIFIKIRTEFGSFSEYIWSFTDNKPIKNRFKSFKDIPPKTQISDKISKDLKNKGMNFVGSTIIYAYMQSIGIVNDHELSCYRYKEVNCIK